MLCLIPQKELQCKDCNFKQEECLCRKLQGCPLPFACLKRAQIDCPVSRALHNLLGWRWPRGVEFGHIIDIALICVLPSAVQAVHPDVHLRQGKREVMHFWVYSRLRTQRKCQLLRLFCVKVWLKIAIVDKPCMQFHSCLHCMTHSAYLALNSFKMTTLYQTGRCTCDKHVHGRSRFAL